MNPASMGETQERRYSCRGFRSVQARTINEATWIFAERQARRDFGPKGSCRRCDEFERSNDGLVRYSCDIGGPKTSGNIHLTVCREAERHKLRKPAHYEVRAYCSETDLHRGKYRPVARFDTLADAKKHARYFFWRTKTTNEPLQYVQICDDEDQFVADLFREGYHGQVLDDHGQVIID